MRQTHTPFSRRLGAGLLVLSATAAAPALADEAQDLGKLVISADRTATPVAQTGSTVTVITAEDIAKKQAVTALDVIREVPGISSYGNGGLGKSTSLSIRGMGDTYIKILVDGMDVSDVSGASSSYDLTHLLADDIERIEVLRGNQSTLYGSSAIGGVISITTKSGKGSGKAIGGDGGVEWGSYGTARGHVNARGESGGVYYSAGVSGLTTQGFDVSPIGTNNTGESDGYKNRSINLRVGSDLVTDLGILDRLNVEALGSTIEGHTEYDGSATADNDRDIRSVQRSGKVSATADLFKGLLGNTLSAAQSRTRRDYYTNDKRNNYFDSEITKYEYTGTLKPLDHHTVVFGADHERQHMRTYSVSAKEITNDGYFANYQLGLLDDALTLTAGARQDDHSAFGDTTTHRATAAYRIAEWGTRLHASYGTGFRAPSLYQLYDPTYGNPDLKAEESRGYDIGIEQSFLDDRLVIDTTFFNTRLNNAITYDSTASKYAQTASARVFGQETSATAQVTDEISVSAGHTWMQARDNTTGQVLATRPHHQGNVRVAYAPEEVRGLDTWAKARFATWSYDTYNSKPFVGGYTVFDLGATYAITDWASVYGRIENIADKDYHTKGWYAESGRAGYVGMRMKF